MSFFCGFYQILYKPLRIRCGRGDENMYTREDLIALSKIDMEQIDSTSLKELTEITINPNIAIDERIEKYFNDIKNPYTFLVHGTKVHISYSDHSTAKTLDECLYNYLYNVQNSDNMIK